MVSGSSDPGRAAEAAPDGTGLIAAARCARWWAAGIQNVLTKSLVSANPHNVVRATFSGLMALKDPAQVARFRARISRDGRGIAWQRKCEDREAASPKRLKITLVKSPTGFFNSTQGKTVEGMGLRRIRHTVELLDTPETRGIISKSVTCDGTG